MANNGNSRLKTCAASSPQITNAEQYFSCLAQVFQRLPHGQVDQICDVLLRAYEEGRRIFLLGNGGSAALASHLACDLGKGTTARLNYGRRFRAIALTDSVPMVTAWANDSSYEDIFAEQLRNLLEPGDLVFAISASGNSPNVIKALELARQEDGFCIGLTGFAGGRMKPLCQLCLVVPSDNMQLIEDVHLGIAHALFTTIRHRLENGLVLAGTKLAAAVP